MTTNSYKESFMNEQLQKVLHLPPEIEQGNVEYKLHLVNPTEERFQHLVTQLKWRIAEGHGEAMYEIGVSDDGELIGLDESDLALSIQTLQRMSLVLKTEVSTIRERVVVEKGEGRVERKVAEIMLRKTIDDDEHFLEIRVAMVGGHDAGKSTLLGVLSQGELDNGRGKARLNLLRHRHEIESGRTSSISRQIIGFNPQGELINFASTNIQSWEQVCEVSSKIVSFLDTCGHEKYQKTTLSGLTGCTPDYACLLLNANGAGVSEVSREHLGLAAVFKVPIMIVITKIDIATQEQLTRTLKSLFQILKSPGLKRIPVVMENDDDVVVVTSSFLLSNIVPVFLTSSVSGEHLDLLTKFLNLLPKPNRPTDEVANAEPEYQIQEIYSVPDIGNVVGGVLISGELRIHRPYSKIYFVGPHHGRFVSCRIKSIHRQRCPVHALQAGQAATCAIELIDDADEPDCIYKHKSTLIDDNATTPLSGSPEQTHFRLITKEESADSDSSDLLTLPAFKLRKGQVILSRFPARSTPSKPVLARSTWEFDAEIHVLCHNGAISKGTQGTLYFGSVRQAARISSIYTVYSNQQIGTVNGLSRCPSNTLLESGQKGSVRIRLLNEPEWIRVGWTILFREGKMKCVGKVIAVAQ